MIDLFLPAINWQNLVLSQGDLAFLAHLLMP